MSYNQSTNNIKLTVNLIDRSEQDDDSTWEVTNVEDIIVDEVNGRVLPKGTAFKMKSWYDATDEDILDEIAERGLLSACNISDGDFEHYLEDLA